MQFAEKSKIYEPMSPKLRLILMLLVLITILGIGLWFFPRFLALYYQIKGGQVLENVVEKEAFNELGLVTCSDSSLQSRESRSQVNQAVFDLKLAIKNNSLAPQSYLLLGRAYCLLDEPENAVESYQKYTTLRPDNPLGHWELALAYEQIWKRWADKIHHDLVLELPLAQVEVSNNIIDRSLCDQDPHREQCYVSIKVEDINGFEEGVILQRPPYKVIYRLSLPDDPAVFRFMPAIFPDKAKGTKNKVGFAVFVQLDREGQMEEIYRESLDPQTKIEKKITLSLSKYAGKDISLILFTEIKSGPEIDDEMAGWVSPVIVDANFIRYEDPGRKAKTMMILEWKRAGLNVDDFIGESEAQCAKENCLDSFKWIERGLLLDKPDLMNSRVGQVIGIPCARVPEAKALRLCELYYATSKGNLIANPEFDLGTSGWSQLKIDESEFRVVSCEGLGRLGDCAELVGRGKDYHGGWYQSVRLEPGKQYRFSLWLRTEDLDEFEAKILYAQVTRNSKAAGIGGTTYQGSNEWIYKEAIFTAQPSDDGLTQLYPVLVTNSGRVWIDDVRLVPVPDD
jgi:hypothetical protein